jgi:hypothetical protein
LPSWPRSASGSRLSRGAIGGRNAHSPSNGGPWAADSRLRSSRWGHIGATPGQNTWDNSGQRRSAVVPGQRPDTRSRAGQQALQGSVTRKRSQVRTLSRSPGGVTNGDLSVRWFGASASGLSFLVRCPIELGVQRRQAPLAVQASLGAARPAAAPAKSRTKSFSLVQAGGRIETTSSVPLGMVLPIDGNAPPPAQVR